MGAGDAPPRVEADQLAPDPLRLLLRQGRAANELPLFELHDPAQVGLEHRVRIVDVVAVKSHLGLKTQRVPRAEAAREQTQGAPRLQEAFPQRLGILPEILNLEAVLPGVSRTRQDRPVSQHLPGRKPVVGDRREVHRREPLKNLDGPRPLDGDQGGLVARSRKSAVPVP